MREVFQRWGSHVGRHDPLHRAWPGPLRPPPAGAKFLPDELRRLMRAARDAGEARALGRELRADPAWLAALCRGFAARYCGTVTMELEHIPCSAARKWGYGQLRSVQHPLPKPHQRTVLKHLLRAEMFEHYLAKEFPASKRFSLEGCEALIPGLHALFETGSQRGLRQVFVGMAHRGRLNVLRNLLGKPIGQIGLEMEGKQSKFHVGDVKYHMGHVQNVAYSGGQVEVNVVPNPSHLEAVTPVVLGNVYACQNGLGERKLGAPEEAMAVVIHGDAAVAGLGLPAEAMQLANLPAYSTRGAVHVVVNNQVGFTTPSGAGRSSVFPTDALKALPMPVLHVNADQPESVVRAFAFAAKWRFQYQQDVCIDLVGYRRHGHNEQDDTSTVLPLMSKAIADHPTVVELYSAKLVEKGRITAEEYAGLRSRIWERLLRQGRRADLFSVKPKQWLADSWQTEALTNPIEFDGTAAEGLPEPTGLPLHTLDWVADNLCRIPAGFDAHPALVELMAARRKMVAPGARVDMAMAEALAIGTLLLHRSDSETFRAALQERQATNETVDGQRWPVPAPFAAAGLNYGHYTVRLTGQDSERGTFNQRHAVLIDQATGEEYVPLNHIADGAQERLEVANSTLSEAAALGFEYGVSVVAQKRGLVMWEAQFGDFSNNAQVIIDQFVSSAEEKWGQQSGLIMMLPHGYDGQGPDHSSARLERFLMLCKDDPDNMPGTSPAHRKEIRQAFEILARENEPRETLSQREVLDHLEELVEGSNPEQLKRLWSQMDIAQTDKVTADVWERFMVQWLRRNGEKDANLFVVNPTTPSQLFHVIRRQVNRPYLKPLIIMAPKFMLHHTPCTSAIEDFQPGTFFHRVIDDSSNADNTRHRDRNPTTGEGYLLPKDQIRKVVICTGQVFYHLNRGRRQQKVRDVALLRLEQISPFPHDRLAKVLAGYPNADIVWCQEEPKNAGAWYYVKPRLETAMRELNDLFPHREPRDSYGHLSYVGRAASASAATASLGIHLAEMRQIVKQALN